MRAYAVVCAIGLLAGCASLNNAGTAKYSFETVATDNGPVCCRVIIENGKEYASLKLHVERRSDGSYSVDLDERNVRAFEGQAVTGGTVEAVVPTLGGALQ